MMATRGRPPSAKTLVDRQLGRKPNPNRNIPVEAMGDGFVIPNHSGDLSAGRVDSTPINDLDIPNKKYVDDAVAAGGGGIDADIIVVLDAEVATLDGNVLILQ